MAGFIPLAGLVCSFIFCLSVRSKWCGALFVFFSFPAMSVDAVHVAPCYPVAAAGPRIRFVCPSCDALVPAPRFRVVAADDETVNAFTNANVGCWRCELAAQHRFRLMHLQQVRRYLLTLYVRRFA